MNLIKGVVAGTEGGKLTIRLPGYGGQSIAIPAPATQQAEGTELTVGIRPSHFDEAGTAGIDLTVELVEHLGTETFVYARHGDGGLLTIGMHNDRTLSSGQPFTARFDPDHVLLFGADEQRIR